MNFASDGQPAPVIESGKQKISFGLQQLKRCNGSENFNFKRLITNF